VTKNHWVILDGWGVIYQEQSFVQRLLTPHLLARGCVYSPAQIYAVYRESSLGRRTAAQFWTELGLAGESAEIEREFVQTKPRLTSGALRAIERLRADYRLGLLSNDVAEWAARVRARFGLEQKFDQVLVSSDVGVRKPDPRIYRMFLERAETAPGRCVFVDDRGENLAAAAALGIRTIQLRGVGVLSYAGVDAAVDCMEKLPDAVAGVLCA
jgi:HAD superfamily hydrolase (TIGR01509 family)